MLSCVYNLLEDGFVYLRCFLGNFRYKITRTYVRSLKSPPYPFTRWYAFLETCSPFRPYVLFECPLSIDLEIHTLVAVKK